MSSDAPTGRSDSRLAALFPLHRLPGLLTTASATAFVVSAAYQVGFFSVVGLDFISVLTPYDYIKDVLFWLPASAIAPLFIAALLVKPGTGDYDSPNLRPRFTFWLLIDFLLVRYFIANPHLVTALGPSAASLGWYLARVWYFKYSARTVPLDLIRERFAAIGFVLLIGSTGVTNGYLSTSSSMNPYILTTSVVAGKHVNVLRLTDKGVLFQRPGDDVAFSPWDDVKELKRHFGPQTRKTLPQYLRDWWSPDVPPPP